MDAIEGFKVYKGLQKPLVFKNLKGKYIWWGAGVMICSFLLCVLVGNLLSIVYGMVTLILTFLLGMGLVLYKQGQGLHNRDAQTGCYIVRRIIRGKLDLDGLN